MLSFDKLLESTGNKPVGPLKKYYERMLVVIESPFAGDRRRNEAYLTACLRDSLRRGEAPFASHRLYTEALDDEVPEDRNLGIAAGLCWASRAGLTAVYVDLGISPGMKIGIEDAISIGRPVVKRSLSGVW